MSVAEDWSNAFLKNKTLLHIDISHNAFDSVEIETFRMGLDQNHTILGLHSAGNECFTDAMGFTVQNDHDGKETVEDIAMQSIFSRILPNLEQGVVKNQNKIRIQANNHCWICEGWSEFEFEFQPEEWVDIVIVPVKLHLSCDNYVGEILDIDATKTLAANKKHEEEMKKNPPPLVKVATPPPPVAESEPTPAKASADEVDKFPEKVI